MKILKENLVYYISYFFSLLIIFSAIIYKLYSLNKIGILLTIFLTIISYIILLYKLIAKKTQENRLKITPTPYVDKRKNKSILIKIIPYFYLVLVASLFFLIFKFSTSDSLISPWEIIPSYFFLLYFLSTLVLIIYSILEKPKLIFYSINFFLSFSVALLIYKIGYGFDSFIHQATEDLISKTGSVDPKPFYYLGQYGLIVTLNKLTFIPIVLLDKLLVPLLSALFLPYAILNFLKNQYSCIKTNYLLIISSLIIPFSFFIVTTPQNLSYLFLIITLLYGLACKNSLELLVIYIFAFASLAIHPIAGIPALLFALLVHIYHSDKERHKKYYYSLIFIISSISLPLIFSYLNNSAKTEIAAAGSQGLSFLSNIFSEIIIPEKENFLLNAIYLYGFNLKYIISLLAIIGIYIVYKNKENCKIYLLSFLMFLSSIVSYLLLKNISFNYLIDYERNNFTDRILIISIIFLLPFIFASLYAFIYKILKQKLTIKIPLLIFLSLIITTSLYISYPRFDRYHNSHGYSTSKSDIDAINYIEDNHNKEYIVLANQQVSAGALRIFGFSRYLKPENLNKEIYFYPIPTGEELYNFYLEAVYERPSKESMIKAMDFAGVEESYLVLNKYWWAFDKIVDEAKLEADSFKEINDKEIIIFKYLK